MTEKYNLIEETLELAKNTGYKLSYISEMTGLDYNWIRGFINQKNDDYRVKKVQKLHDFFKYGAGDPQRQQSS